MLVVPATIPSQVVEPRLDGWKQIAAHFGVSVRAAQDWESERGLPVHRLGGGKRGRVYALVPEVEDWYEKASTQTPLPRGTPSTRRWRVWGALGASVLVLSVFAALLSETGGTPDDLELLGNEVRILDSSRRQLWAMRFPDLAVDGQVESLRQRMRVIHQPPVVLLTEIRALGIDDLLHCFSFGGSRRWTFVPGKGSDPAVSVPLGSYKVESVTPVSDGRRNLALVVSCHKWEHHAQVALIDLEHGTVVAEYWHPGWLDAPVLVLNLDDDPGDEVVLAGVNNPHGLGHPAVTTLNIPFDDPRDNPAAGANYYGTGNARERTYFLLPRLAPFSAVRQKTLVSRAFLELDQIVFVTSGGTQPGHVFYFFDAELRSLVRHVPSDELLRHHRILHRQGLIELDATPEVIQAYGKVRRFPTAPSGDDPAVVVELASVGVTEAHQGVNP